MAAAREKRPLSVRLPQETVRRLEQRSKELGETQSALVQRYVEQGLRMDAHPLIYFRDAAGGRRPALVGTRLDVAQVIQTIRQNGNSVQAAGDYLGLPVERVQACLSYYADHETEIDDLLERARELAEREQANWRRQQEILA